MPSKMRYEIDDELMRKVAHICDRLNLHHIDLSRLRVIRSFGTKSRYVLARCHTLSRIMQTALGIEAHYIIEVLSESFDKLSEEDKTKILIHELMHIPHSFAGGFRHHRPYVNKRIVEKMYKRFVESRNSFL